jgi:hypothetical protein
MCMAGLVVLIACSLTASIFDAEPVSERIQRHFKSDEYTVTWGAPASVEPDGELEIGDGYGHAGVLRWLRFQPGQGWVDVLSIEFDEGVRPYNSKWPPDRPQVTVQQARMKRDVYAALLHDLGVVCAAELKPIERHFGGGLWLGSQDSWAYAHLKAKKMVFRLDWAGYPGSLSAVESAKPQAAVELAHEATEGLDFKDHALTQNDRAWASAKFARDWKHFRGRKFYWWVRESHIALIGTVGDATALPTLRRILEGRREDRLGDESDDRCIYYAINAVTRLTKRDVRDKPVESMDIETTRRRIIDVLRDDRKKETAVDSETKPN